MNISNSEVSPKAIEQLDSLKPDRTYPWNPSSDAGSSNLWEFSVGELYGCVCHRAFDEIAPSPDGSNPDNRLQLTDQALKIAGWDQRSTPEASPGGVTSHLGLSSYRSQL
jgi:hypothetical protein